MAVSAALAVFDVFESENRLQKAQALGEKLAQRFAGFVDKFDTVGEMRGLGAMRGFTVVRPDNGKADADGAKALVNHCIENGVIILATGMQGNLIRCLAPFTIGDEHFNQAIDTIEKGLAAIAE